MLEILKSKVMMGFAIIVLGIMFVSANATVKLEENEVSANRKLVIMNVQ